MYYLNVSIMGFPYLVEEVFFGHFNLNRFALLLKFYLFFLCIAENTNNLNGRLQSCGNGNDTGFDTEFK